MGGDTLGTVAKGNLELRGNGGAESVRTAFRSLSLQFHRDIEVDVSGQALRQFRQRAILHGPAVGMVLVHIVDREAHVCFQLAVFIGERGALGAGAIDSAAAETNPHIVMVLNPGGIHETDFLNENSFTKESSQLIQTWTKAFLGLQ